MTAPRSSSSRFRALPRTPLPKSIISPELIVVSPEILAIPSPICTTVPTCSSSTEGLYSAMRSSSVLIRLVARFIENGRKTEILSEGFETCAEQCGESTFHAAVDAAVVHKQDRAADDFGVGLSFDFHGLSGLGREERRDLVGLQRVFIRDDEHARGVASAPPDFAFCDLQEFPRRDARTPLFQHQDGAFAGTVHRERWVTFQGVDQGVGDNAGRDLHAVRAGRFSFSSFSKLS